MTQIPCSLRDDRSYTDMLLNVFYAVVNTSSYIGVLLVRAVGLTQGSCYSDGDIATAKHIVD